MDCCCKRTVTSPRRYDVSIARLAAIASVAFCSSSRSAISRRSTSFPYRFSPPRLETSAATSETWMVESVGSHPTAWTCLAVSLALPAPATRVLAKQCRRKPGALMRRSLHPLISLSSRTMASKATHQARASSWVNGLVDDTTSRVGSCGLTVSRPRWFWATQ